MHYFDGNLKTKLVHHTHIVTLFWSESTKKYISTDMRAKKYLAVVFNESIGKNSMFVRFIIKVYTRTLYQCILLERTKCILMENYMYNFWKLHHLYRASIYISDGEFTLGTNPFTNLNTIDRQSIEGWS